MNIKELFENAEFIESIIEDIEDIPEDSEVTYEVWALGYDAEKDCTDDGALIGEFTDPDEAVACAEKVTIEQINELGSGKLDPTTAYFSIEVETVVEDPEDEGTMNIGTVYSRDLWVDGEYGSEEDAEPTIFIYNKDYELLEDGILKVRRELLKDYNKNDCVKLCFAEEETCTLTYKVISKVEYADGDYYHLDFIS